MTAQVDADCVIVGGGFTGLTAAAHLTRSGRSVIVLEQDSSLGGLAGTFEVDGFELEKFYHHWFTSDRHIAELAGLVGVSERIVTRPTRTGMYYSGNFFRLSTPVDLLKLGALPLFDRLRTGVATLVAQRRKNWRALEDITAKQWLVSMYGPKAYKVIWEPLLVGKFGRYADQVSAVWFWNKLALRGGSRGRGGNEELAYFEGGFGALAAAVGDYVEQGGGTIRRDCTVTKVHSDGHGNPEVITTSGKVRGRSVLLTTPLPIAAGMLEDACEPAYLEQLSGIEYLGNVCLILTLKKSLSELYWINVNDPSFPFVGIIEHTNFQPAASYGGKHVVYLSKYLPVDDPVYSMDVDELFEYAKPYIERMFPDFDAASVEGRYIWRSAYAQPVVVRRYSRLVPDCQTPLENVFLATMAQVYPEDRGTNYAVREGRRAAELIHDWLDGERR